MNTTTMQRPQRAQRPDPLALVTEEVIRQFERDGAVWIPALLSDAWVRLIGQGVQRNLNSPGPNLIRHFEGEPGEYHDDYGNYLVTPEYQRLLADSPIADVVAKVLRTENLWLFLDQIFVKEGGESRRTPWHQDIPWLMADGSKFATIWIALQPLAADETLECVAGSHRGPMYDHGTDSRGNQVQETNGRPPIPDIDAEPGKWPIIKHASQPGDVLIFHPSTLHGGGAMKAGGSRRSLNMRFYGDGTRYVDRVDGHSPAFHGVSESHRHGDLLRHPWFPQVYPRAGARCDQA
jgi:ectoine hydroxylase-related dioxygenase (phytanoyl-CoA dioxygenase family)